MSQLRGHLFFTLILRSERFADEVCPHLPGVFLLTIQSASGKFASVLKLDLQESGNNSVVECNLAKVEVASSNLVSRSNSF